MFWTTIAVVGRWIAPYDPRAIDPGNALRGPSPQHLFGTDSLGRDVLSRLIVGTRSVLMVAPASVILALAIGIPLALMSGYYGRYIDEIIMRSLDVLMAVPTLLLALLMLVALGPSAHNVVLVIGVAYAPRIARVVRSVVLDANTREYVAAARLRGESALYIMSREILPNTLSTIKVEGASRFSYAIFVAASLSFLGMGVQPPTPDWGLMVSEGRDYIHSAPWIAGFPALALATLVVAANLLTDALGGRPE